MIRKANYRQLLEKLIPYIGLSILILVSVMAGGSKFTAARNLRNILIQSSILMVISVGSSFVMSHGNMDFANGGTMGLCMVVAIAVCKGIPAWAVLPVCIITGLAIGVGIGFLTTKLQVVAFIVGMCVMRLSTAILYSTTNQTTWFAPMVLNSLNEPWFYLVTCILVVVIGAVVFEYTKIGHYNKAIGVNKTAAALSGIHVNRYLVYAFAASGLCAGVAAFMTIVRTGGVSNSTGSYEVDPLSGLTIGGMPLTGGAKASIRAAVIGALALTILNNILILLNVDPDFVDVIKGAVFLTLVLISHRKNAGTITR